MTDETDHTSELSELTTGEHRQLDAWAPMSPPAAFADRVLAARARPTAARRRRWPAIAIAIAVAGTAAVATVTLVVSRGRVHHSGDGAVSVTASRMTVELADRGVAVAEVGAELTWTVDESGSAVVAQAAGNVFYRVEHGGPFLVQTPAGDVRVTGTCLRIEVSPMNAAKQMIVSGAVGAALASTVTITVYEGHVLAESRGTRTELAAGSQVTLSGDGKLANRSTSATARDQPSLDAQREIATLRTRVRELETKTRNERDHVSDGEDGRPWYSPSHDTLLEWAAACHVRFDDPNLDRFSPVQAGDDTLGLAPGEVDDYNTAMSDMAKQWHDEVRALYLEATGDTAGADTLSVASMTREIDEKSQRQDHQRALQRISRERAGLASAPADLTKLSPIEQLVRDHAVLGDQSEASLAKRLGPDRAHAIRGDGWGSKSDMSGCPKE